MFDKFEQRLPTPQNAVDIFRGKWACHFGGIVDAETGGEGAAFTDDPRPMWAADALGRNGRIDGYRVLELGPLEAGHTYQLERLGGNVSAIEANVEAYLKCLVAKELLGLHSHFMLGDFCEYMATTSETYDMVFASGVLYHMAEPISVIESIARVTDRCFVWTHYYDEDHYAGPARVKRYDRRFPEVVRYEVQYDNMDSGQFWGGIVPLNTWLGRDDLLAAFERVGLGKITLIHEQHDHPHGAAFSFAASRS